MPNRDIHLPSYPALETVLDAIAGWVKSYRLARGARDDLADCGPNEVMTMARDLGLTPAELRAIARKGPHAADLLGEMLVALKVDPNALDQLDPCVKRDLQRLCVTCGHKRRCEHELAAGTAAENFRGFCPNAFTLDALFGPSVIQAKRPN